ncbi:MAG: glycosyltransferase family 39 protein [Planctomycetia bacterium]|nr:glycosyltransferase family 39 protein [Planctomycetia bacterium]
MNAHVDTTPAVRNWRYPLLILAACLLTMFVRLGATRFWDEDEGFFATTASEMYSRGDMVVPTFNGALFGHKPPWMYWMMMAGFRLFGVNEFGARFGSAVFGTATALLTYFIGARLINRRAGLLAGLALASCLMFTMVSRAATPDTYLTFFGALALYLFASRGFAATPVDAESTKTGHGALTLVPPHWWQFALMYAVMGLGVLTKGPIGVLLPMAVIGLFLLCTTPRRELPADAPLGRRVLEAVRPFGPVNFARTVWRMRPLTAINMVLLVAGPWYFAVARQTDGAFLREFFLVHHWHRFSAAMENHSGPIYYYVLSMLVGMFPWTIFTVPAIVLCTRQIRQRGPQFLALTFLTCWLGVYLVMFSLASTKLSNYVLPAYPALALLFGFYLDQWIARPQQVRAVWAQVAPLVLAGVGGFILFVLPLGGLVEYHGQTILDRTRLSRDAQRDLVYLGLVGLPALVGGIIAWRLSLRQQCRGAIGVVAVASVLTTMGFWSYAGPRVDRLQAPQTIAQRIRLDTAGHASRVAGFCFFRPSMVYYAGQNVTQIRKVAQVGEFFATSEPRYLFTTDTRLAELRDVLPSDVAIVDRRSRFPEAGEIVLLSNRPLSLAAQPQPATH